MWLHHLLSLAHKLLLMSCTLHCTIIYCLWWPTLMIRSSVIQHTHIRTYTGLCYCYCTTDRYINVWYTLYSIHTCMVHAIQYSHMHGTRYTVFTHAWYTLYSIHTCMVHAIQYSHMHGTHYTVFTHAWYLYIAHL